MANYQVLHCLSPDLKRNMSQTDEPMVEAAAEEEQTAQRPTFSLGLLKLIKTEQGQNGVKHADYTRYR
jgi:hypothetical protein